MIDIHHTVEDGNAITYVNGVRGTLNQVDVMTLVSCAKNIHQNGVYAETGSYLGCSATLIALHTDDVLVYAHDIWVNDWRQLSAEGAPPPEHKDYFYTFYNAVKRLNFRKKIIPIRGDSSYTLGVHENQSIDMAFIDGDHSHDGCLADLVAILPKMKEKSVILLHDCNAGSECRRGLDTFSVAHQIPYQMIPNSCGMAIINFG